MCFQTWENLNQVKTTRKFSLKVLLVKRSMQLLILLHSLESWNTIHYFFIKRAPVDSIWIFLLPGVSEDRSVPSDRQDHQYSDLGKTGGAEDDNVENTEDTLDEDNTSEVADASHPASSADENPSQPGGQVIDPQPSQSHTLPKDSTQKSIASSASTRRAVLACRRLEPSASAPPGGSPSPSSQSMTPRSQPPLPRTPSPSPCPRSPLSSLSPSSCHVSTSPLRPASPIRVQSHGLGSPGSPGSIAGTFAQCQNCPHPRDRPATARLVSYFYASKSAQCHVVNSNYLLFDLLLP